MALAGVRQDVVVAARGLLRAPGFTVAAVLTLGLGIGATSAIATVVNAVLVAPLPYAEPDRRVMIWSRWVSFDKTWLSDAEILDCRRLSRTMTAVAGWTSTSQNLAGDIEPTRVGVGLVTANTFDVLGVRPLLGRTITEAEDHPNAAPVVVLGHALWHARYGADPGVLGRRVLLDDVQVEVVGVMPPGFRLPTDFTEDATEPTEMWRPLQIDTQDLSRGSHGYYAAAVLASGQTAASASEELRALTASMTGQGLYPDAMKFSAFVVPLDDEIRGTLRPALWLLSGAVVFVLLVACANVANLLLVRGDARVREIAVRSALGASSRRLVRQLLAEGALLAVVGGVLGLMLGAGALRVLVALDPTILPSLAPVRPNGAVVGMTLLLSVMATLLFGVVPALRTLRVNLVESLRDGGPQATSGVTRQRMRHGLVIAEVALAIVLITGAALMARSLAALGRIPLGFSPKGVLTMRVAVPPSRYDTPEKVVAFYRQLVDDVRNVPGVSAAGVVRALPLATTIGDWGIQVEGYVPPAGTDAKGDWQVVSDGAFEAMGMRLVRGRWFTSADRTDSQPVIVVNETLARTYFPDRDAVGGRISYFGPRSPSALVVGIVADERHNGVTAATKEKFYVPHSQWHVVTTNVVRNVFIVARTSGDPLSLAGPIRAAVRRLDATLPIANVRPMTAVVAAALSTPRLTGFLMGPFALVAITLAIVGLYGVLSYVVARRTHEIGIRLAMGAARRQVLTMVLARGLTLALWGIVLGVAAALALTRAMRSVLYEVEPADPLTFVTVPLGLLLVAGLASLVPALRAVRVSPVVALRVE